MTRDELIRSMMEAAVAITGKNTKDWTYEAEDAIWTACSDWNRKHEDEEIFMCDYQSEDNEFVNGFMIEDDYFIYEE